MSTTLCTALPEHYPEVLRLNQQAIPAVSHLDMSGLQALAQMACRFDVVLKGEQVCGFVILLPPAVSYASLNYQWFAKHYEHFVYVDRVVVSPECIGQGIGRQLYRSAIESFKADYPVLTCEVNIKPHNAQSLAFHRAMGSSEACM